ncbi:hypothetical protein ACO0K0_20020 [Undibacterium sp. SXout11W]|uniref:hypothetical protein n=1 Tax=Undibacterium sp. SXout11W TaxID=3413050 RepID=UPI003BEFDF5F
MYLSSTSSSNSNHSSHSSNAGNAGNAGNFSNHQFFEMPEMSDLSKTYFADFDERTEIAAKTPTRMGSYQFTVVPFQAAKGMLMQVERHGQRIISAHLPAMFTRGELLSASMRVRDTEYLLVAANSASKMIASGKRWLGIFRADGKNVYANVFDQQVMQIQPNQDGISMLFLNGDRMRIKL